jgi:hypothetical protein
VGLNAKQSQLIEKRCLSSKISAKGVRNIKAALADALNFGGYFGDEASFLSALEWMVNLEKGNDNDWRGNYFIKHRNKEGANEWMTYDEVIKIADEYLLKQVGKDEITGYVYQHLEESNRKRIGPKGRYKPASVDLSEKIDAIWSPKEMPKSVDRLALMRALEKLSRIIPSGSISPIGIDVAMRATPYDASFEDEIQGLDPTTNSGPPWYKRNWSPGGYESNDPRRKRSEIVFSYYRDQTKKALAILASGKTYSLRAMAAQRLTQRGPDQFEDGKYKRLVTAMGKEDAIMCKMVSATLIPVLRLITPFRGTVKTFSALSDAPVVDMSCQLMMRESGGRTVLSTDYSGFDQTQVPWLIAMIGKVIGSWVRGGSVWVAKLVESMAYHTSLLSPVGFYPEMASSMKSGHGFTNLIDSLISLVVLFYGEEIGAWTIHNAMVQGDDGATDGLGVNPEQFERVCADIGLSASSDKQFYEEGAMHYLQKLHLAGKLGGIYSVYRALGSILSYERLKFDPDQWNPYLEAMQTISRIDNCAFHPQFPELVKLISEHDKYKLGGDLDAGEVITKAGELWQEVLNYVRHETINARTGAGSGFVNSPTNGVLREEILPSFGSHARFVRVYGERAIKAEELLKLSSRSLVA